MVILTGVISLDAGTSCILIRRAGPLEQSRLLSYYFLKITVLVPVPSSPFQCVWNYVLKLFLKKFKFYFLF